MFCTNKTNFLFAKLYGIIVKHLTKKEEKKTIKIFKRESSLEKNKSGKKQTQIDEKKVKSMNFLVI